MQRQALHELQKLLGKKKIYFFSSSFGYRYNTVYDHALVQTNVFKPFTSDKTQKSAFLLYRKKLLIRF